MRTSNAVRCMFLWVSIPSHFQYYLSLVFHNLDIFITLIGSLSENCLTHSFLQQPKTPNYFGNILSLPMLSLRWAKHKDAKILESHPNTK